jgi:hypothetical protein
MTCDAQQFSVYGPLEKLKQNFDKKAKYVVDIKTSNILIKPFTRLNKK